MSIKEELTMYFNKETSAVELIRALSGIFNPDMAVNILALINQICRHEQGDLDTETFKSMFKID